MHGMARKRLLARLGHGDGWTALRLEGVIDEHNGLDTVAAKLADAHGSTLVIDLEGIRRINSIGVRDWVVWLRAVRTKFRHIVLMNCPPPIMNEINLVRNFAEGALIYTFQAPYYCDRCGVEGTELLDASAMLREDNRAAPAFPCGKPACANALDEAEETYFAFMDDQRGVPVPPRLAELAAAARRVLDDPSDAIDVSPEGPPSSNAAPRPAIQTLGRQPQRFIKEAPRTTLSNPVPGALMRGGPTAGPPPPQGDWVFIIALVSMLAALGVLIFLIATLE